VEKKKESETEYGLEAKEKSGNFRARKRSEGGEKKGKMESEKVRVSAQRLWVLGLCRVGVWFGKRRRLAEQRINGSE
jgi:hypothetical protein